jgi:hypothetical protein
MRSIVAVFLFLAVALSGLCGTSQGGGIEFTGPATLAPGLTSGANVNYVTPDGTKMLLAGGGLWRSYLDTGSGVWGPRASLGFPGGETTPSVDPDGNLYYSRNVSGSTHIYRSPGPAWSWLPGAAVSVPGQPTFAHSPYFNGTDLYFSNSDNDIMVSHWDGGQFLPAQLAPGINTASSEAGPWVSNDGTLMLFASNRPGGYGFRDLYSATWNAGTAQWGNITNLGPNVNTAGEEGCPSWAYGANMFYFNRSPNPGTAPRVWQAEVVPVPSALVAGLVLLSAGLLRRLGRT